MPSSHAALAGALAMGVALNTGFASAPAAISYVILAFTMHHAVHTRKHHTMAETIAGLIVGVAMVWMLSYW